MGSFKQKFHHENWPTPVFYAPVFLYYLYNSIKFRKFNYFTAVNPALETGGLCGFSKFESFKLLPQKIVPTTIILKREAYSEQQVGDLLKEREMNFPLVVKPDQGERGFLVFKVNSLRELMETIGNKSLKVEFLLQEYIQGPLELGVFLIRKNDRWKVSSITSKTFLSVVGDGESTMSQLINSDPRVKKYYDSGSSEKHNMYAVPKKGESILLEPIGNHCRGTEFVDECCKITDELHELFHENLKGMEGVNYCRLDLRTASWTALMNGEFKVMEVNGVSAEPAHIYDTSVPLTKAYKDLFKHWSNMAGIAKSQIALGAKPERLTDTIGLVRQHMKKKKELLSVQSSVVDVLGCEQLDLSLEAEDILRKFSKEDLLAGHECSKAEEGYERTVLFKNKDYEIVFCHWRSGDKSVVHQHPNQKCWFRCLQGELLELRSMGQEQTYIKEDDLAYIDDSMGAHQMLNVSTDCSYSVHIYETIKGK